MQRRTFLKNSSRALLALPLVQFACAKKSGSESQGSSGDTGIGIQLYSLASLLSKDFKATLRTLAETGYKKLEFAGPYYFSSQEERDNSIMLKQLGLKGSGYYDFTPKELRTFLDELGLTAPSAHMSTQSLDFNMEEAINASVVLGHQYIVCPIIVGGSIDDYKSAADKFNKFGEACKKAGIRFCFHNHSLEFGLLDGEMPMEVLLKRTDPDLVSFEMDVFWTEVAGVDPVAYIKNYPGRFQLMHLKDMASKLEAPDTDWRTFTDSKKALAMFARETSVGDGIIDFSRIINAAGKSGIKHFFVEQDFPPDPAQFLKRSFENLSKILK